MLFVNLLLSQLGSVLAILHATTSTRYGRVHELAIVFAGIGAAATASSARPMRVLAAAAASGLATTPSLAGHALDPGEPQALSFAADLVHVWAAAVWLGGLLALVLSLWEMRRVVRSARPAASPRARARERLSALVARRFSRVALAAVLLIAASGLARALAELTSVQQLWQLSYGRAILVKTGLLLALLVLAWINRFRLVPRLAAGRSTRPKDSWEAPRSRSSHCCWWCWARLPCSRIFAREERSATARRRQL